MAKGVMKTYALWVMGGPLGLHHLYLGRDSHALLWLLTLGGFGVGWAAEFFRIPAYVKEANREATGGDARPRRAKPPPISPVRFAGQVCVGVYFGAVALISLNSLSFFYLLVLPLCVGAGVHLVSCIGGETSDLLQTLSVGIVTSLVFYGSTLSPLPVSLAASIAAAKHRRFKEPQPASQAPETLGPRLYRLGLAWLAFSVPLGYSVFHNTTATLYYLSDCLAALLDALWFFPGLKGLLEYVLLLPYKFMCALTGGGQLEDGWKMVLEILLREHSQREREALKVFSLSEDATLDEITRSYRELVKKWHPDHHPSQKLESQEMFIRIQEAYETLQQRHKRAGRT